MQVTSAGNNLTIPRTAFGRHVRVSLSEERNLYRRSARLSAGVLGGGDLRM